MGETHIKALLAAFHHRKSKTFPVKSVSGCGGMTVVQTLRRSEAIIFDFDGLMADTEPLHCKALRKVINPLGVRRT